MDLTQKFGITGKAVRTKGLSLLSPCVEKLCLLCCQHDLLLKRQAVTALGKIGVASSLDFIASLLVEDADTIKEAANAMSLIEDDSIAPRLIKAIQDSPPVHQAVMIPPFEKFSSDDVIFALSGILTEPASPEVVKLAAATVMGQIGDSRLSLSLLDCLEGASAELQITALKSLALTGYESEEDAFAALTELYTNEAAERPKVRSAIMSALRAMSDEKPIPLLKKGLKDPNPRVIANAIETLGKMNLPPRKLIPMIKPMLDDVSNSRVRANIAVALEPHDDVAATVLSGLLNSSEKADRASAAYAARFVKNDRMAMWLTTLLASEQETDVINNILDTLEYFDNEEVFEAFVKYLESPNPVTRKGSARALGRIGNNECRDSLVTALKAEEDPSVIADMVSALGKLGDGSLIPVISEYLQHTDLRVQANSVEALNAVGTVEIVPYIEPFLNSSDNRVKANAAVALWSMGSLNVVNSLYKMLDHINLKQRSSAAYAIGEIGLTLRTLNKTPDKFYFLISALKEVELDNETVNALKNRPAAELHSGVATGTDGEIAAHSKPPATGFPMEEAEIYFTLMAEKKTAEAKNWLENCIERQPDNSYFKYLMADFYRLSQNVIKASKLFTEHCEMSQALNDQFLNARIHLANIYGKAHDQEQSLREYFNALKVQLSVISAEVEQGLKLIENNETNEASLLLKNIVSRLPINSKLHYTAGRNFLKSKNNELAFVNLFKAYLCSPENGEILLALAFSSYKTGRYKFVRIISGKIKKLLGESSPLYQKVKDLVLALDKSGL